MLVEIGTPGSVHHDYRWCSKRDISHVCDQLRDRYAGADARIRILRNRDARTARWPDGTRIYPEPGKVRISVDYENNAIVWWDALREALDAGTVRDPAGRVLRTLGSPLVDSVVVISDTARAVRLVAESLPGWEGPVHPLHFHDDVPGGVR